MFTNYWFLLHKHNRQNMYLKGEYSYNLGGKFVNYRTKRSSSHHVGQFMEHIVSTSTTIYPQIFFPFVDLIKHLENIVYLHNSTYN